MTMSDVDLARKANERGVIIRTLREDYTAEMTSVRSLIGALDLQGISLSHEDLSFHLQLLADAGYIRIWRARELPGYRKDRRVGSFVRPETIMFAKLLPLGLRLLDGLAAEDPQVRF
jgi:DNA-binding transcriptional ArsR family regulator